MATVNPSVTPGKTASEKKRIPMSVPMRKLEVPPIPGFVLYWFRDVPNEIARALRAGYAFVESREVDVNSVGLGNSSAASGNTDLGSRVTVPAGGHGADNQGLKLVLMKIPEEHYKEDVLDGMDKEAAKTVANLTAGTQAVPGDSSNRYVDSGKTVLPDFFKPKSPKH